MGGPRLKTVDSCHLPYKAGIIKQIFETVVKRTDWETSAGQSFPLMGGSCALGILLVTLALKTTSEIREEQLLS